LFILVSFFLYGFWFQINITLYSLVFPQFSFFCWNFINWVRWFLLQFRVQKSVSLNIAFPISTFQFK
jgi:hypothetical protein